MSKMSELDMERQRIARIVPPAPPPTMIQKGGMPASSALGFLFFVGVMFTVIAIVSITVLGSARQ